MELKASVVGLMLIGALVFSIGGALVAGGSLPSNPNSTFHQAEIDPPLPASKEINPPILFT